jgi:peroxiredoxin
MLRWKLKVMCLIGFASGTVGAGPQQAYRPTALEQDIDYKIRHVKDHPESERPNKIIAIAQLLRKQRPSPEKVRLATRLAWPARDESWSGEALQEVVDTLAQSLVEEPPSDSKSQAPSNELLADLGRYFDAKVTLDTPGYRGALAKVEARSKLRRESDFTLQDIEGASWTRSALKGKVVLVNFWGLSCVPCLAEMPALREAYQKFKNQGFVVLAITADSPGPIRDYLAKHPLEFPKLSDPTWAVGRNLDVVGIPVNLVYDRSGALIAESLGPWTKAQLWDKLGKAGLR